MMDQLAVHHRFKEPAHFAGRFTGAGAAPPTIVAFCAKGFAAPTRSGVGALVVAISEPQPGVIQSYDFNVASPANAKTALVTPVAANSASFTIQVAWQANSVAVDLQANEELVCDIWTSRSGAP